MILNRGECVVFDTPEQAKTCLDILIDNGFKFWTGASLESASSLHGVRWWHEAKFPDCCATLNEEMKRNAMPSGRVTFEEKRYHMLTFDEWMNRRIQDAPSVEDLL